MAGCRHPARGADLLADHPAGKLHAFFPINPTGGVALVIIALSASGAIYLILEMNNPFSGLMQIPSDAFRNALGVLGP